MLILATAFALAVSTLAHAGERKIDPSALPPAITSAVQARFPGAIVSGAAVDGKSYEATLTLAERRIDLSFSADGTCLEEEEFVGTDALPDAVTATLNARWKGWTIERSERAITPKGTTFEVIIQSGEHTAEVVLSNAGVVKRVESGEEEDHDADQ